MAKSKIGKNLEKSEKSKNLENQKSDSDHGSNEHPKGEVVTQGEYSEITFLKIQIQPILPH